MASPDRERDGFATALLWVGATGVVLSLLALVAYGLRPGASVGAGAALAASNLWALGLVIRRVFRGARGGGGVVLFAILKMFGLFTIVFVLLRIGLVDPVPLLVGYGSLPLGIVGSALSGSLRRP